MTYAKKPLLIAVDLDGSLLHDSKQISARNKRALQEASRQGHYVVIATGRPFRASQSYYHQLQLNTPIVNFNGALVHHPLQPSWGLFHSPLDNQTAKQIITTSENFGVRNIMVEVMDEVYLREHDELIVNTFIDSDLAINRLPDLLHSDPTSILLHPYEYNVDQLRERLEQEHAQLIEHRKWGAPWNVIEIVRQGLSKAVGLQAICDHYQIPAQNVIAFGDEDNDLEMIQFAGVGIAMDNGISLLKEAADQVTASNNEDGIALYLEKNVL